MNITFEEWKRIGILAGWAEEYCYTHEKRPMTDDEWVEFYDTAEPHLMSLAIWPGKAYRIPLPEVPESDQGPQDQ